MAVADDIKNIKERVAKLIILQDIAQKKKDVVQWEERMSAPSFWENQEEARMIGQSLARAKEDISLYEGLAHDAALCEEFVLAGESDEELSRMYADIERRVAAQETVTLLHERYDERDAILSIHAGTGGVDAMDWAEMLFRMYLRYCERQGWKVRILDETRGAEAGVKSVTFEIAGRFAYGLLKSESGVHRLVRISPFDAEGMRHTSFALVEVLPDMGALEEVAVRAEDIKIDAYKASGHGGQGVNTTDSAIRITHLPTGIVVTCQNERSQLQNKETALRYLRGKLARIQETEREDERRALRGTYSEAAWGNQIRSYVLNPYRMVKDHRTNYETSDVEAILDGVLEPCIESYLRMRAEKKVIV
jgi:peptide chain release factor 2